MDPTIDINELSSQLPTGDRKLTYLSFLSSLFQDTSNHHLSVVERIVKLITKGTLKMSDVFLVLSSTYNPKLLLMVVKILSQTQMGLAA